MVNKKERSMEMKERNIVTSIILSIVTCGIYAIYWFIVMTDDVKTAAKDTQLASGGVALLLTLVTCGIYGIYWAYKIGELTAKAQADRGLTVKNNSVLYLVLELIGFGIIVYALVQNDLNEMVREDAKVA